MRTHLNASQWAPVLLLICCFVWWFQIESRSQLPLWSAALAVVVGSQLLVALLHAPPLPAAARSGALASGVIVYLMLQAFAALQTRRALQGVAGMALLLPLTAFVRPTIIIAAAFLSILFMASCRCRFGGCRASALMTFTPATLCVGVLLAFHWMGISIVGNPAVNLHLASLWSRRHFAPNSLTPEWLALSLTLAIGVVLIRMLDGQTTSLDLVYLILLILLEAGITFAPVTPSDTALTDVCIIVYGGAMSLVTTSPPRRWLSRILLLLLAFVGAVYPWVRVAAWASAARVFPFIGF
jgi:hypothetical protein